MDLVPFLPEHDVNELPEDGDGELSFDSDDDPFSYRNDAL